MYCKNGMFISNCHVEHIRSTNTHVHLNTDSQWFPMNYGLNSNTRRARQGDKAHASMRYKNLMKTLLRVVIWQSLNLAIHFQAEQNTAFLQWAAVMGQLFSSPLHPFLQYWFINTVSKGDVGHSLFKVQLQITSLVFLNKIFIVH